MLDAFADRIDVRVARRHVVADHDAAVDFEIGGTREFDVGPDPDRQHNEISRDPAAVCQQHRLGPLAAKDFLGLRVREEGNAAGLQIEFEAFQSGLSWLIILRKRANFRRAFHGFDVERIASLSSDIELSQRNIEFHVEEKTNGMIQ